MFRNKLIKIVVALAGLSLLASAAYAAIPAANGTISACKDAKGTLKVIDTEAGQTCNANQTLVEWNQQGPSGPQGPPGPAGTALGHAEVGFNGDVYAGTLTDANVVRIGVGKYCFGGLGFDPRTVAVTLAWQSPTPGYGIPRVRIASSDTDLENASCPIGHRRVQVGFTDPLTGAPDDERFFIVFH